MINSLRLIAGLLLVQFFTCPIIGQILFKDISKEAGIDHQFEVFEGMFGGGIAVFDSNNDGFEDLYLTSGMNDDAFYLNNGDGTFTNLMEGSGLEITKKFVTQGVAAADVNRDGFVDLFVTTIMSKDSLQTIPRAQNLFFLNQGDNQFVDATEQFGLSDLYCFSTGVSFGDFNADGYPDAYVGNYFLEYDGPLYEINDATIVNASKTARGYLLLNKGGETFENVYEEYGLNHRGFGFGGLFTDFDNDGDSDLLINHDFGYKAKPNYLLRNDYPKKSFTYVEEDYAMDLRINAMAAAIGDYDNNGFFDYFITNIKYNRFMVSGGKKAPFESKSEQLGTSMFTISWGANFADFDQDTDLDLFVINGDLNPNCTPMGNSLFENQGGRFQDVARGATINDYGIGRGSVIFDIENDGDLDVFFINQKPVKDYPTESRTKLFRNDSKQGNWTKIQLTGDKAETHGIGSRIEVVAGGAHMMREVDGGGSSHLSQNSTISHFGLGEAAKIDSVIVTWVGGQKQILVNQPANQMLKITQEPYEKESSSNMLIWLLLAGVILIVIAATKFKNNQK